MVGGGRGRGTGRWQRRASEIGLGTPRLYPDEACVCVRLHIREFRTRAVWGPRSVAEEKVSCASSCLLLLRVKKSGRPG